MSKSFKEGKPKVCYTCDKYIPEAHFGHYSKCNDCHYLERFVECNECEKSYHTNYFDKNEIGRMTMMINDGELKNLTEALMGCRLCYSCALNNAYNIWNKYKKNCEKENQCTN